VRYQIAQILGIPEAQVHSTLDRDLVVVTVTGDLRGRSAKNAMRRRQQALRVARLAAASRNLQLSISFAVHDAVSVLEDLVRTTVTYVLGHAPEAIAVNVGRSGKTSVVITLASIADDVGTGLKQVIGPILRRTGLSLIEMTLVTPMREDISDARLLRATKILAPCDSAAVARRLKQSDGIDIAADLVHRRLDVLRQKGLLVYLGDRRFALTLRGLAGLPPSNSRRNSSDIERVLALARSKW
jgi:hypothetical protein